MKNSGFGKLDFYSEFSAVSKHPQNAETQIRIKT